MTLWSRGFVKLRDKLKSLYLHYHSAYDNQTWQKGNSIELQSHMTLRLRGLVRSLLIMYFHGTMNYKSIFLFLNSESTILIILILYIVSLWCGFSLFFLQ